MIVTKHHDPLLDQDGGQLLVPAQVLPEPVTEEHRGPHRLVWPRPPVAGEQLVASAWRSVTGNKKDDSYFTEHNCAIAHLSLLPARLPSLHFLPLTDCYISPIAVLLAARLH